MYLEIIEGRSHEAEAVLAADERWLTDVVDGHPGWLGGTAGVTADEIYVAAVLYDSAAAAAEIEGGPKELAWWAEEQQHFDGEPTTTGFDNVILRRGGMVPDAGFVQVMIGQLTEKGRAQAEEFAAMEMPDGFRPDVVGSVTGVDAGAGRFVQVIYFSTEAEARAAESAPPPPEYADAMAAAMAEMGQAIESIRYLDLTRPGTRVS